MYSTEKWSKKMKPGKVGRSGILIKNFLSGNDNSEIT